jgi:ribosomal protein S18 acetylase RimI-like enzyme
LPTLEEMVVIRPFRVADQCAARALVLTGLGERFERLEPSMNPDLDDIATTYPERGHHFPVAEKDGHLVAVGALRFESESTGHIVRVSVETRLRRRGLARAMVRQLIELGQVAGLEEILVETNRDWHSARRLYENCGFVAYEEDAERVYMRLYLQG